MCVCGHVCMFNYMCVIQGVCVYTHIFFLPP